MISVLDDPRLQWQGAVSLERTSTGVRPWRIPHDQRVLFDPGQVMKSGMPSGVRVVFQSDTRMVSGVARVAGDIKSIDLLCDGELHATHDLSTDPVFSFDLPTGMKRIELWLPQFGEFELVSLEIGDGVIEKVEDTHPKWVIFGASNCQCRQAASPTGTWPAVVSHIRGWNLTNLAVGGQNHLDIMMARTMASLPADILTFVPSGNFIRKSSFNLRTLRSRLLGFVQILRETHPETPLVVMTLFHSRDTGGFTNDVGISREIAVEENIRAVEVIRGYGDENIHLLDGLEIFGSADDEHLMEDGVHMQPSGYRLIGERFAAHPLIQGLQPGDPAS
jgi:salicyl acyltransferaes SsfX3-like protein/GDSL-like lipase/acylhydrolase family protein